MISFIIPTLNEEKYLEKTLKNLAEYKGEKEIIVSDGGSTDRTVDIAKRYQTNICVYNGKNRQTIASGRNAGAELAKGDLLAFIDADVYIPNPNQFFQRVNNVFEENKKIIAAVTSLRVLPEYETWADRMVFTINNLLLFLENNIFKIGGANGELQIVRKSSFGQVNGFDKGVEGCEDHELFWRLAKIGRTKFISNQTIYHTGRRAHKIGWLRLLCQWITNCLYACCFEKETGKEWSVIR